MNRQSILVQELFNASTIFRKAIEQHLSEEPHNLLVRFPSGCCKTTSFLLARYLHENGFDKLQYVYGWRNFSSKNRFSHGWLQIGDLIVDITADQFELVNSSILVTFDRSFYLQFLPHRFFDYDSYMKFNESYQTRHDEMYDSITSLIR